MESCHVVLDLIFRNTRTSRHSSGAYIIFQVVSLRTAESLLLTFPAPSPLMAALLSEPANIDILSTLEVDHNISSCSTKLQTFLFERHYWSSAVGFSDLFIN